MQTRIRIIEKETIAPAWWRLVLAAPDLAPPLFPGQFLLVRCADPFTCYLRRPVFPVRLDDEHVALLIRPKPDPGLAWLATRQPGDELDVIGPLGHGFPLADHARNLLLVSDSQTINPLLGQMNLALEAGLSVTLALGGSRAAALYPVDRLPSVVEVQYAALDGSIGHRGPVTDLLPDLLPWADSVCAVGSTVLYRALRSQAGEVRLREEADYLFGLVPISLLPCGVGACMACSLPTSNGIKFTCVDGPVFDLMTLDLDE